MTIKYDSGADMWREYVATYGEAEARGICNRYLDMQIFNKNPEEMQFCKELYAAMQETAVTKPSIKSAADNKTEKPSILDGLAEKKKTASRQSASNKAHSNQHEL